ncbi:MAG: response regulator transcription factor [Cytophaga sp.]|nr:response regulator transcription factor [Undibacterium sp.]
MTHAISVVFINLLSSIMNLFIVEDSVLIQNRLVQFIEELPGMRIMGVSGDITDAYRSILDINPDAMILDLQLGDGNGLSLLKDIKKNKPNIKVMILTNHATDDNRLHALRAGADNFLDKSTDFQQIPRILHEWQCASSTANLN